MDSRVEPRRAVRILEHSASAGPSPGFERTSGCSALKLAIQLVVGGPIHLRTWLAQRLRSDGYLAAAVASPAEARFSI